MELHSIENEYDYRAALREVSAYFDNLPEPNTEAGNRFDALCMLVEAYEAQHFPIEPPIHE